MVAWRTGGRRNAVTADPPRALSADVIFRALSLSVPGRVTAPVRVIAESPQHQCPEARQPRAGSGQRIVTGRTGADSDLQVTVAKLPSSGACCPVIAGRCWFFLGDRP